MRIRNITAGIMAAAIALSCGCTVRSSSDAAWVTGSGIDNKSELSVSFESFDREYKYWLLMKQIPDDTAEEVSEECKEQRESVINYLINEKIVLDQAKKLGVDQFTQEELDEVEANYNEFIESSIESFRSYVNAGESGTSEVNGDAAILAEAEKIFDEKVTECGMTRDDMLMWFRNAKIADKLKAKLAEEYTVEYSDAETEYANIVDGIQQVYENDPVEYEQNLYYKYYWLPDNSRMIKHILIKFDSDDSSEISACRENNDETGAAKARERALEKLKPEIEEIKAQLDNGADFDELAQTYSEDTGLSSNPNGYLVVPDGGSYYAEFQSGAYELENVGDYMLVGTDLGWHIIMYASDAVITEENEKSLVDAIYENLQENASAGAYNDAMKKWREEYAYDIAYDSLNIDRPSESTAESSAS
ncbi:MAG: peptidylprolyl isomerase [Oscillospiraceae bacterium]